MIQSEYDHLRKYQRQLHLFQMIFAATGLALMFFGIFWFPQFIPYCAIGVMFSLARNDFLYHRINNYIDSNSVEKFESWLKNFRYTQFVMPILDFFSFTPIIYLFLISLNHNFALPVWLMVTLFIVSIIAIPLSVKIAQRKST